MFRAIILSVSVREKIRHCSVHHHLCLCVVILFIVVLGDFLCSVLYERKFANAVVTSTCLDVWLLCQCMFWAILFEIFVKKKNRRCSDHQHLCGCVFSMLIHVVGNFFLCGCVVVIFFMWVCSRHVHQCFGNVFWAVFAREASRFCGGREYRLFYRALLQKRPII